VNSIGTCSKGQLLYLRYGITPYIPHKLGFSFDDYSTEDCYILTGRRIERKKGSDLKLIVKEIEDR